jgi:hypothetical protein
VKLGGRLRHLSFSPDGRRLAATQGNDPNIDLSRDPVARFIEMPSAVPPDPDRVSLELSVRSGLDLLSNGEFRALDAGAWRNRRRELEVRGQSAADG